MKRLASFVSFLLRWCARQALTSFVIIVGAVVGWGVRKATGPTLISESVQGRRAGSDGPRPAAVGTIDSGARAWLGDAMSLTGPSASLLELRRQLDAGEISDFGRLARAMLTHPLPLFRQEALEALLPAWGRKDPAGALQFALDYGGDLREALPRESEYREDVREVGRSWLAAQPEKALRYLTAETAGRLGMSAADIFKQVTSPGPPGTPGLVERLKLLASAHGEAALARHAGGFAIHKWAEAQRPPSPDDWRTLATSAVHPGLKKAYQEHAFMAWREAVGDAVGLAEARAWWGGVMPLELEFTVASPKDAAELLRTTTANDLGARSSWLISSVMSENPGLALELARDGGWLAWMKPDQIVGHTRSEVEIQRWLNVLPDPAQRQDLMIRWLRETQSLQTAGDLAAGVAKAEAFGVEGEAVVAAVLGKRTGALTQQVPEMFASLPPEVQVRSRLEVVTQLGMGAPDVAAELWMDATPAELAQPGAAVVAEALTAKLLARDAEVASAWVQQLPPGESRDRAVAAMIERIASQDPATCADWAATIENPAAHARALAALERAPSTSTSR